MFDSIFIGMSGMEGFSKGLKVISNNVANLNTPGFKSSNLQFTDAFYQQGAAAEFSNGDRGQPAVFGGGLDTLSATIDFKPGTTQQTSNPLDVSISGDGFLVAQDKAGGAWGYTRDGQLQFDKDGVLTSTTTGKYIMGYPSSGSQSLGTITLGGLRTNPPKATEKVAFSGNITSGTVTSSSSQVADTDVDVAVNDSAGGLHTLHLKLKYQGTNTNTWAATVTDGTATVGEGSVAFDLVGKPVPGQDTITFSYAPQGRAAATVTFDLSKNVTAFNTGNVSQLSVASQDGYGGGAISKTEFDADGNLQITYSNGQKATGGQLALAHFDSLGTLEAVGGGEFRALDPTAVKLGRPSAQGPSSIASSQFEMSNVDLSGEFSNLIVMQRGYQASSNILSTANEMLQQLFDIRGGR